MSKYIFTISTGDTDRHNSRLIQSGWELENYKKNPIVFYQEGGTDSSFLPPDPDMVIGRSKVWLEDGKLMGLLLWDESNELAMKIKSKVDNGSLRGASVLFNPLDPPVDRKGVAVYNRMELLAWKVVNIPSNPKCLIVSQGKSKAARLKELNERLKSGLYD